MRHAIFNRSLAAGLLLATTALTPTLGHAQSYAPVTANNNAMAVSDLSGEGVFQELNTHGRVSMSGAHFTTDSIKLDRTAEISLSKVAQALERMPDRNVVIIGNTDSVGDFNYNLSLSKARAEAVRNVLTSDPYNIAPNRVVSIGVGSVDPVATNLTDVGRASNRRVTFIVLGHQERMDKMAMETPAHTEGVENAKMLLRAMTDYMAAADSISFSYDASLEVVTSANQKLALVSSGSVVLNRPDKLHTTRQGGFADFETFFDGETLTFFGKNANLYVETEAVGTIDELIDVIGEKYDRSPPAADLLTTDSFDKMIEGVTDVKDLGSGVINGQECDFLAFRAEEVDWQIWIAHGDQPYPCRYTVTTRGMASAPQYTIQIRDWSTGDMAPAEEFTFVNTTGAEMVEAGDLQSKISNMPANFKTGE
jgi:hypothetical protein